MDKYYRKAEKYIEENDVESALTVFVSGVDHGYEKCAYGLIKTVMTFGSYVFDELEAVSIFKENYQKIKEKAENGDTEAMVMIAEGERLGFIDDDETYFYWLEKAKSLGNKDADRILLEIEEFEEPIKILVQDEDDYEKFREVSPFGLPDVVRAEPDATMLDDYGISDVLKEEKLRREILEASQEYVEDAKTRAKWHAMNA